MNSLRLIPALLATILTALVSFWICFVVVATATRTSERPAASVKQPTRGAAGTVGPTLTLRPVPALRVRPALIERSPARPRLLPRKHRTRAGATAIDKTPSPNTAPPMSAPAAPAATAKPPPAATPKPPPAATPTTSPRPAPTPRPTPTAAPKDAAAPDFDQSQPTGFDTSG